MADIPNRWYFLTIFCFSFADISHRCNFPITFSFSFADISHRCNFPITFCFSFADISHRCNFPDHFLFLLLRHFTSLQLSRSLSVSPSPTFHIAATFPITFCFSFAAISHSSTSRSLSVSPSPPFHIAQLPDHFLFLLLRHFTSLQLSQSLSVSPSPPFHIAATFPITFCFSFSAISHRCNFLFHHGRHFTSWSYIVLFSLYRSVRDIAATTRSLSVSFYPHFLPDSWPTRRESTWTQRLWAMFRCFVSHWRRAKRRWMSAVSTTWDGALSISPSTTRTRSRSSCCWTSWASSVSKSHSCTPSARAASRRSRWSSSIRVIWQAKTRWQQNTRCRHLYNIMKTKTNVGRQAFRAKSIVLLILS